MTIKHKIIHGSLIIIWSNIALEKDCSVVETTEPHCSLQAACSNRKIALFQWNGWK